MSPTSETAITEASSSLESAPLPDRSPEHPKPVHWFRRLAGGNTRKSLAWIYAILLIASADHFPNALGTFVCFLGAAIRFWSSGYLRKNTRPSVGGPYGLTRNPLYLGTYLMLVGASLAVNAWALAAISSVAFAVIYHCVILDEEEKLDRIFGEPYQLYLKTVSRFFPLRWFPKREARLAINPIEEHLKFSWKLTRENRAHPWISFLGLIGFLWLVAYLRLHFTGGLS